MPAKFDVEMRRDAIYKCFPEELTIRPMLNGRQDKPDVEWLIADILRHGQLQPVVIWNDGGEAVLCAGFSRWRAISEINKRKLTPQPMEIKCSYAKTNEQGAFIRNISENRMRNSTTPVDDAHNIATLFEWTLIEEEVAKIYFPTAATVDEINQAIKWVRSRIELIKLTPEAEKAVQSGRLSESAAQAIAKLSSSQQKEALKSKEGKLTAKDVKAANPKKSKPAKIKIDPELRRRITAVIESADFENFDENKDVSIDVNAVFLASLKNFINEI